jgi:hypothetical protein
MPFPKIGNPTTEQEVNDLLVSMLNALDHIRDSSDSIAQKFAGEDAATVAAYFGITEEKATILLEAVDVFSKLPTNALAADGRLGPLVAALRPLR